MSFSKECRVIHVLEMNISTREKVIIEERKYLTAYNELFNEIIFTL